MRGGGAYPNGKNRKRSSQSQNKMKIPHQSNPKGWVEEAR